MNLVVAAIVLYIIIVASNLVDSIPIDCREIKKNNPSAASGSYTIQPAASSFSTNCDMTTYEGGWTYVKS
jgi:hypothetical protein